MRGLLVAIGFLTRLPVPARVWQDTDARSASLAWYPAVGLLLGALLLALAWLLQALPPLLAAGVLLASWVGLTGALHLDGLADSADAWVGGLGDRQRTLEIMKDPRCGPSGVIALDLLLLIKFAALASLPPIAWPALLLAPLLARTALVVAFVSTSYVRSGGLGAGLASTSRPRCGIALLSALLLVMVLGLASGVLLTLAALAASVVVFVAWRRACLKRLGGITGDTAGALAELTEAAVLVAAVVATTLRPAFG